MPEVKLEDASKKARDFFDKGRNAMDYGNHKYAIEMFLNALEEEPGLLQAREYARSIEIGYAKNKKGLNLSSLSGLSGTMAVKKLLKKDPAKAVIEAEKLLKIDALNLNFVNLFVEACEKAELPEAAIQTLELVRNHHRDNVGLLEQLAHLYDAVIDHDKARSVYEEIYRLDPTNQEALKKMKDQAAKTTITRDYAAAGSKGAYKELTKDKEEAIRLEQESKRHKSQADLEKLVGEFEQKIAAAPENLTNYRNLADYHSQMENYDKAIEVLSQANELTGGTDPEIERGIAKATIKIYQSNIRFYEAEGDQENVTQTRADMEEFIVQDLAECVKKYPNDLTHKFNYGKKLFQRGDFNEAIKHLQKAQSSPKFRHEAIFHLGLCYKAKNQLDLAVDQFKTTISEIPIWNDLKMDIIYEMASTFEEMGDWDKALDEYKQIYVKDSSYKDVAEKIERGYEQQKA